MGYDVKINDDQSCYASPTGIEILSGVLYIDFSDGTRREATLPATADYSTDLAGKADKGHSHFLTDITDYDPTVFATAAQGAKADTAAQPGANLSIFNNDLNIPTSTQLDTIDTNLTNHILDTLNPHGVTKAQVALGNVDNTSDINKPVSTAQQTEITNKYNSAISYVNSKVSSKVDKVTGSRLMTNTEGSKIAEYDENHYKRPLATLTELTSLLENTLYDNERRYVASEGKDYFYDADATTGDAAPTDQTSGTGFWKTSAQSTVAAYDQWILNTEGTFRKNVVNDSILDFKATGLLSVDYASPGVITYSTTATKNDTDTNLKARANHTGTQAISTVTGLQDALDSIVVEVTQLEYDALVTDGTLNPKTLYIIT